MEETPYMKTDGLAELTGGAYDDCSIVGLARLSVPRVTSWCLRTGAGAAVGTEADEVSVRGSRAVATVRAGMDRQGPWNRQDGPRRRPADGPQAQGACCVMHHDVGHGASASYARCGIIRLAGASGGQFLLETLMKGGGWLPVMSGRGYLHRRVCKCITEPMLRGLMNLYRDIGIFSPEGRQRFAGDVARIDSGAYGPVERPCLRSPDGQPAGDPVDAMFHVLRVPRGSSAYDADFVPLAAGGIFNPCQLVHSEFRSGAFAGLLGFRKRVRPGSICRLSDLRLGRFPDSDRLTGDEKRKLTEDAAAFDAASTLHTQTAAYVQIVRTTITAVDPDRLRSLADTAASKE